MTEEKSQTRETARNLDREIDKELGIETVSFKCNKDLLEKLTHLAAQADMELEPFIRRICSERTEQANKDESSPKSINSKQRGWGDLRDLQPINKDFGFSTGQPIDRYYIDLFLQQHCDDIRGCVLEIADGNYTKRFGGTRVVQSEILYVTENEKATLVGDLATGHGIPHETFDCIILTQTLPFIYDLKSAVANCHRALKHGGVLLCTVNGISQISRYDMERWGDFWRFTDLSLKQLLMDSFEPASRLPKQTSKVTEQSSKSTEQSSEITEPISISTFGNVLTATAFLMGLPSQELQLNELNYRDADYQVLIGARARKF